MILKEYLRTEQAQRRKGDVPTGRSILLCAAITHVLAGMQDSKQDTQREFDNENLIPPDAEDGRCRDFPLAPRRNFPVVTQVQRGSGV